MKNINFLFIIFILIFSSCNKEDKKEDYPFNPTPKKEEKDPNAYLVFFQKPRTVLYREDFNAPVDVEQIDSHPHSIYLCADETTAVVVKDGYLLVKAGGVDSLGNLTTDTKGVVKIPEIHSNSGIIGCEIKFNEFGVSEDGFVAENSSFGLILNGVSYFSSTDPRVIYNEPTFHLLLRNDTVIAQTITYPSREWVIYELDLKKCFAPCNYQCFVCADSAKTTLSNRVFFVAQAGIGADGSNCRLQNTIVDYVEIYEVKE